LQVSRSTVRAAVAALQRESRIEVRGKRHCIVRKSRRQRTRPGSRVIAWLSPRAIDTLPEFKVLEIDEIRRRLQQSGFALHVHTDPRLNNKRVGGALDDVLREVHADAWLLNETSGPVQRWFAERQEPTVIAGSRHSDVRLPALDFDYRAVGVHAAGRFQGRGHTSVALLMPRAALVGDMAAYGGFVDAFDRHGGDAPLIAHHDGTVEGVYRCLNNLFSGKRRPSGLFVFHPNRILTVFSYLMHERLRIPEDVSLVSRQDDTFLADLVPSVATYTFSIEQYAMRVSRLAVKAASGASQAARQYLVPGEYKPGDSLGRHRRKT